MNRAVYVPHKGPLISRLQGRTLMFEWQLRVLLEGRLWDRVSVRVGGLP